MRKTKIIITCVLLAITIVILIGLYYCNNHYYAQNLNDLIHNDDVEGVSKLLDSRTGNVNSRMFMLGILPILGESINPTPLHIACKEGSLDIVKILIDRGADVNAVEPMIKQMPLDFALKTINKSRIRIANTLLDNGAIFNDNIVDIFRTSNINEDGTKNTQKELEEHELFVRMVKLGAD